MSEILASGFLSYARSDDEREGGRITRLARAITDEFETLTAQRIDIFIDREDIQWGDGMRRKLDEALQETTFFIPVLTPTYFTRNECRNEMVKFTSSAKALGLEELLMSIRYVPVQDLREDSADELKAVAAGMQYVDWSELRFMDEDRGAYRSAVNGLAQRLADLTHALESKPTQRARQASIETGTDDGLSPAGDGDPDEDDDDDLPSPVELLAELQPRMQSWLDVLTQLPGAMTGYSSPFAEATADMNSHNGADAFAYRVLRSRELAKTVEEPLITYETLSKEYAARLLDLDPSVRAMFEVVSSADEPVEWDGENPFVSIKNLAAVSRDTLEKITGAADGARKLSKVATRDLRPVLRRFEVATRNIADAQSIIDGWSQEIDERRLA